MHKSTPKNISTHTLNVSFIAVLSVPSIVRYTVGSDWNQYRLKPNCQVLDLGCVILDKLPCFSEPQIKDAGDNKGFPGGISANVGDIRRGFNP